MQESSQLQDLPIAKVPHYVKAIYHSLVYSKYHIYNGQLLYVKTNVFPANKDSFHLHQFCLCYLLSWHLHSCLPNTLSPKLSAGRALPSWEHSSSLVLLKGRNLLNVITKRKCHQIFVCIGNYWLIYIRCLYQPSFIVQVKAITTKSPILKQ